MTLTREQQDAFDLIEGTYTNTLIHGKPGVGKSVLIRALRTTGQKNYTLAAPTGLAAINIDGKTLHSVFGISVSDGVFAPDYNKFSENQYVLKHLFYRVKFLIIDEISMVRADMLDFIDRQLRHVKGKDEPFGGIQIIAVGDFFQLPPVVTNEDRKQLKEYGYKSEFAFDAKCFEGFKVVSLGNVLRQSDKVFIDILHAARTGSVSLAQLKLINKQVGKNGDFRVSLTSTNRQAEAVNIKNLSLLKTPAQVYTAEKFGYWPALPVEDELKLKVGAQVMVKKNRADIKPNTRPMPESRIVNGTIGKIAKLPTEEEPFFTVELEDGAQVPIYKQRWERKEKVFAEGKWFEETVAAYTQWPLQLAWAISMHKSQGQSFDKVHIDPSRIFAAGQLYVALSRCRSLEGVSLQSPLQSRSFWADKRVLEFTSNL